MSSPISGFSQTDIQSLYRELQQTSATSNFSPLTPPVTASLPGTSDSSHLSPFAQILSTLQQIQQSNPTQYAQLTQQISTNLQTAAQADTTKGDTAGAAQLTQLANDFSTASTSGQLPNIQDLAQAIGGGNGGGGGVHGGGHHHHAHAAAAATDANNNNTSTSSTVDQLLKQLLAAFQANNGTGSQSSSNSSGGSQNAFQIISSTLTSAGISLTS